MPDLKPEWRADGSLLIQTRAETQGEWCLFRFLLTPSAVKELRGILEQQPTPNVFGAHEKGPGT